MILRYLFYLSQMYSGSLAWKPCYDAWNRFGNFIGSEEYEQLLKDLRKFNEKYKIKS